MAQRSRELFPERSAKHALGAELRRLRVDCGLSQARLGELVHHSGALIGKIEKAERLPTAEFCALVDTALGTGGRLSRMRPTADLRVSGVPADLVVSPWTAQTSLRLLSELTGRPRRNRELVVLDELWLDHLLVSWSAAGPVPDPAETADATPSELGTAVVKLMARRVADLRTFDGRLGSTVLCDLALAELRCLAELISGSALCAAEHRPLFGLASETARLTGRLHRDGGRSGRAWSFFLMSLRCAADAGDLVAGTEIVTEMNHLRHDNHRNGERP